ncbi:hypothetical protein GBZ86_13095 [Clostridium tarantellae]|uniref:Peptidase M60 domain-containing protein n=1 Tax=Clostridium tarantellae TaxID=39493 RepID=A0A6I1MR30_9CLOT|nr:hypothetical protein [Clostridium tarantellae]
MMTTFTLALRASNDLVEHWINGLSNDVSEIEEEYFKLENANEQSLYNSIKSVNLKVYNALEGTLENGAIIENLDDGKIVGWLGGPDDGSVNINVNMENSGIYNLGIKYVAGESRSFKIDVNEVNTEIIYNPSPTNGWTVSSAKLFTLPISLNSGDNLIKFHGEGTNYAPSVLSFSIDIPTTSSIPTINIYRKTSVSPTHSIERKRFNIQFHALEPLGIEIMYPTDVTMLIKGENIAGTAKVNLHDVDNMRYISDISVNENKIISIPRKGELFLNVSNISSILGDSISFSFQVILSIDNDINYIITPTFDIRENKIFEAVITDENEYNNLLESNTENGMLAISENARIYFPKCKYIPLPISPTEVLALHEQTIFEHNKLAGLDINASNQLDKPRRNFVLVSARNEQVGYMSASGTMLDTHPKNSRTYFSAGWGIFHEYGHLYDQGWGFIEIWTNMYSKNMAEKTIGFTWLWGNDREAYENKNIEVFYKDYLLDGNFIERGFGFGTGLYFFISLQEFFGMNFVGDMTGYYRNNEIWLRGHEYVVYAIAKIYGVNVIPYMEMYGYYQYTNEVVNFVIDNSKSTTMIIPGNVNFEKYASISVPPTVKSIYAGTNKTLVGISNQNAKINLTVNNNIYTATADSNSKFSIIISENIDENSILKITSMESDKAISVEKKIKVKTLLSDNIFSFYGLGDVLIATLGFDVTNKVLVVKSGGSKSHVYFKDNVYFSATLYDNNGQNIATSDVTGNENAGDFATILNNKLFNYGYYIKLKHAEPSRLSLSGEVINSPNSSSPFSFKNIDLSRVTFYIRSNGIEYKFE